MSNNYLIIMPEITKGMKSLGSKSLLKINSKINILDQQIKLIKAINRRNKIYLSTGFQHSKIQKHIEQYTNVYTIYEKKFEDYNETKHLLNFMREFDEIKDVFIINNGILFKNNCFTKIKNSDSKIYILDKPKENFTIGCSSEESKYLFYELPNRWSECIFLTRNVLEEIDKLNKIKPLHNHFLFEVVNMIFEKYHIKQEIIPNKDIIKINSLLDLKKAKRFL